MAEIRIDPEILSEAIPDESSKDSHIFVSKPPIENEKPIISKIPKPIKKLDGFISHLNRLMHTRDSHDFLILFLAFASHFVATALETPIPEKLQRLVSRLGNSLLTKVPRKLSSFMPIYKLSSYINVIRTYRPILAERARALSDIMDDWQIISRLWGLVGMWTEGKEFLADLIRPKDVSEECEENPRDYFASKAIKATYILGLIGYFGFENLAWLTRRGVLKRSEKAESKFMIWSLKGWGLYVFAELAQLSHDRSLRNRGLKADNETSRSEWRRRLVQMLLYAPLTIHWIKGGGLFPELLASFLAAYTEYITVQALWRESA